MNGQVIRGGLRFLVLIAVLLSFAVVPGAAESVTAAAGDEIPLSGTAEGADEIYLFVTGPNLPPNGAQLDDIGAGVVTGDPTSFTRAAVADGQWQYTWNTRTVGGVPDAGTYTVYVVREPVGRRDLGETTYASITVVLTRAGLDATIDEAGTLAVRSVPEGAEVWVDGVLQGTTPVDLTGVPAGTHMLELRKAGYATINESIEIEAGTTTEIARELEESTPSSTLSPDETACEECESPPAIGLSLLPALAGLVIWSCARAHHRAMTR